MRKYLKFIGVGSFFATVEEFLTVVVLKHDLRSYLFTLLILFPVFLTFVWFSSRAGRRQAATAHSDATRRRNHTQTMQELIHFFTYGILGLLIEWFVIGLSPWSNPAANPLLMLIFQLGMFSFWATVGFAPRLFTNTDELSRKIRAALLKFYVPYFVVVYVIGFLVPQALKFVTIIGLIVFGYLFLNLYYTRYFSQAFRRTASVA